MCCSALQRDAARCSVLQCVAVRCSVLQCVAVCCKVSSDRGSSSERARCVLQCVAVCEVFGRIVLLCPSLLDMCCSVIYCVAA